MDTGPVFGMVTEPIAAADTSGDLLTAARRIAAPGCWSRRSTGSRTATLEARPQPADGVSLAPKLTAERRPRRLERAGGRDRPAGPRCTPAPGAWTTFRERRLKLGPVRPTDESGLAPGELSVAGRQAARRHRDGRGRARRVQPEGKPAMAADAWARGLRLAARRSADLRRPMAVMTPPARLALDVLCAVRERGAYANLLLPQLLRERRLPARDRAFATELTYGALRAQGSLDLSLAASSSAPGRPAGARRAPARAPTSCGAPGCRPARPSRPPSTWYAAVSPRAAGFANAVLRRVADDPAPPAPRLRERPPRSPAVVHAHPRWIVDAFADALGGRRPRELGAALAADDERPHVHLVARRISRERAAGRGGPEQRARPMVAARGLPAGRRPGRAGCGPRRARRRAGRGQPAGRAGAGRGRRSGRR